MLLAKGRVVFEYKSSPFPLLALKEVEFLRYFVVAAGPSVQDDSRESRHIDCPVVGPRGWIFAAAYSLRPFSRI